MSEKDDPMTKIGKDKSPSRGVKGDAEAPSGKEQPVEVKPLLEPKPQDTRRPLPQDKPVFKLERPIPRPAKDKE